MTAIKAIVRNGRIEVEKPIDLPDGTVLTIPIPNAPEMMGIRDDEWSDPPEAIEAWIRAYDALEPVEFTPEERAAWQAARQEQKDFELAADRTYGIIGWAGDSATFERLIRESKTDR